MQHVPFTDTPPRMQKRASEDPHALDSDVIKRNLPTASPVKTFSKASQPALISGLMWRTSLCMSMQWVNTWLALHLRLKSAV